MAELEARWHDLGEFIREQRKVGHLSLRKLSDMAGISNPYLSQIERGLRKPSAEILQQIARALEISSETLYPIDIACTRCRCNESSYMLCQLNCECPDTTRSSLNKNLLPFLKFCSLNQCLPSRQTD